MPEMIKYRGVLSNTEVGSVLPVLRSPDYYIWPSVDELVVRELRDSGFCSRVPNFVVGRVGYGCVAFSGETDVRSLDLEDIVKFSRHSVAVYENETEKPPVGEGLNKTAEVTLLLHVKYNGLQGEELDKFVVKLKRCTERQGARFVSFDESNGEWKFLVRHFSRFGLNEDDEEEEEEDILTDGVVAQQDEELDGSSKHCDQQVLSHSLPAHLRLDPVKMQEMRMIMFPDNEDEDLDEPSSPEKRHTLPEYMTVDSPGLSSKSSIHRSPLQGSLKKSMSINRASPLGKSPQALLEYHQSSPDVSPPQNILMIRQSKCLPPRTIKVNGFKVDKQHSTPFGSHYSNNVVDAALFMGRSFRVGWGPNGVLVHAGSPICNPVNGLSSVINLERVAIDSVVRGEDNKIKEELIDLCFTTPLNLHKSLDHELVECQAGSSSLRLQKVVASRFSLSEVCRNFIGILEKQLEVPGVSSPSRLIMMHQVMVWELIKVLFSEREADEQFRPSCSVDEDGEEDMVLDKKGIPSIDPEARPYVRRADFSLWLQDSVCHRVQEEVSCLSDSGDLEHILLLLTGRQLDVAVELAASRGDVRLAILLSQCGGSIVNRNDIAQQLELWRDNGLDFKFIEKDRIKVYELLSGNIEGALAESLIDWKRYLGSVMWFQLPPDTPLTVIIQTYHQLLINGRAPQPVPIYIDEGPQDEALSWREGDHYDLAYYLMLLHASDEKCFELLKVMFSAFSSSNDPLDYHMIWHQRALLEAVGTFNSNDLHILDTSFISQLLSLGQCHWAIYVAIHMPYREDFPDLQSNLIREILFQYCELWSAEKEQCQFIEDLGVPSEWMHEALAIYFQYYGDLPKALEHFLECSNWQKAHSIFMTSVAHSLFLSSQHSDIRKLVNSMGSYSMEIANWDVGAQIFIDYYDLKSSLQEAKTVAKQDTLETMTDACRGFFKRLDQSLVVWGSKLPLSARSAYSKMVEQLNKLLGSIPGGSTAAQMSCFDVMLSAPIPDDFRSCHLQDAVSIFTYFIAEGAS